MKFNKHTYTHTLVYLIMAGCLWLSCAADDSADPTLQELAFERLAGNWTFGNSGSIILDGQDVSLNYPGFSLSFDDGNYSTINAGDLLPPSGTWEWVNEEASMIRLDGNQDITINNLTENRFIFSFNFSGRSGERSGTSGSYTVSVVK